MINKKDGIEFEFIQSSEKSNINLVFVHGSGCNKTFLRPIHEEISQYNCYFIDLPGHGGSDDTGYNPDNYVKSIINFLTDLDNVILIGHSLGGTLTLRTVAENIKCIKATMILDSGANYPNIDKGFMDGIHNGTVDMKYLLEVLGDLDNPLVIEVVSKIDPLEIMVKDFLIDEKIDVKQYLKDINIPTTIITGGDEILTPVEYSELIHKNIKNSKLVIIPGVKHMLPVVKRKEVAKLIQELADNI